MVDLVWPSDDDEDEGGGGELPSNPDWIRELALSRMSTILRSLPGYVAQAEWITDLLQEFAEAQARTRAAMNLSTSSGRSLDLHGRGLNQPRLGMTDDVYRQTLMVRWVALFHQPTLEGLYTILNLLTDGTAIEYRVLEFHPLAYTVELRGISEAEATRWAGLIRTAKPYGIRLDVVAVPEGDWFRFDVGPGYDEGQLATTF